MPDGKWRRTIGNWNCSPGEHGESSKTDVRGIAGGALDGLDHGREGVAEDHGAPGAEVVDVAVAVGVVEISALGALEEGGMAANGAESPHGRIDAAGNVSQRLREQLFRFGACHHAKSHSVLTREN